MVQAGTLFGYLAAFITIVLGLALADLLTSLHRLLRARHRVTWRFLPLLLAVWVMLSLLTGFFELWEMTGWQQVGYYGLLWQVCNYIPIFLAACAVLPDEVPPGPFDLDSFYFGERRYIIALIAVGLLLDVGYETFGSWQEIWTNPVPLLVFLAMNLLALAGLGAIAWSERKWVHWLGFLILFAIAHLGYSAWTIEGASALTVTPALP